jgi:hypothetical protein
VIQKAASSVVDETAAILAQVSTDSSGTSEEELKNLKRRKLVQQVVRKSLKIVRGPEYRQQRVRKMADLTKAMLGDKTEVMRCM